MRVKIQKPKVIIPTLLGANIVDVFLFPNALTRSTATGQPLVLIGPVQKLAQNKSMRKNALKLIQNAEKLSVEFREEFLMVEKI